MPAWMGCKAGWRCGTGGLHSCPEQPGQRAVTKSTSLPNFTNTLAYPLSLPYIFLKDRSFGLSLRDWFASTCFKSIILKLAIALITSLKSFLFITWNGSYFTHRPTTPKIQYRWLIESLKTKHLITASRLWITKTFTHQSFDTDSEIYPAKMRCCGS